MDSTIRFCNRNWVISLAESLSKVRSASVDLYSESPSAYTIFSDTGGILNRDDIANNMSEVIGSKDYEGQLLNTDYFNRYRHIYPGDEIKSGKKYCFIVKPDLNIPEAIMKDPYFRNLYVTKPHVLQALTHYPIDLALGSAGYGDVSGVCGNYESNHFISFLSDRVLSFALPDFQVQEYKLDQPFTGFSTAYAGNSNESRTNQSTQLQFRDTNNLDILTLFDAWIKYIDMVSYGVISPYRDYAAGKFTYGTPIIDYATSIYEIITKSDGTEIIYWAKITGTFPTTVPHSNYQFTYSDDIDNDIEIQFSGGLPETLNPRVFADFNYNAGLLSESNNKYQMADSVSVDPNSLEFVPHARYGYEGLSTPGGSAIVGAPYITYDETYKKYRLRWLPRPGENRPVSIPTPTRNDSISWYGDYNEAIKAGFAAANQTQGTQNIGNYVSGMANTVRNIMGK